MEYKSSKVRVEVDRNRKFLSIFDLKYSLKIEILTKSLSFTNQNDRKLIIFNLIIVSNYNINYGRRYNCRNRQISIHSYLTFLSYPSNNKKKT